MGVQPNPAPPPAPSSALHVFSVGAKIISSLFFLKGKSAQPEISRPAWLKGEQGRPPNLHLNWSVSGCLPWEGQVSELT